MRQAGRNSTWLAAAAVLAAVSAGAAALVAQSPVTWAASVPAGTRIEAGGHFDARADATVEPGWHLYALTQPAGGPQALAITVSGSAFSAAGRVVGPLPRIDFDPNFNIETQFHDDAVSFVVPVATSASARGSQPLTLEVSFQTCNDRFCLPPALERLVVSVPIGSTVTAAAKSGPSAALAPMASRVRVADLAADTGATTLAAYVGLAALMGALSLLTPCVFPMVPITVSYFTSRAERRRSRAVAQATVYGLGIVLTFTAVGFALSAAFGASGLNRFAADPWINLGIAALFIAFALNLFGAFELALPSRWLTGAARVDAGRGRFVGTLLMGLAFTLTSFTCTAPFLGTLLVVAAAGDWVWPLAGLLAFATVFALPFVGLALAPQLVAGLPRSGPWLLSVKASMGLLELAAAMKFLSNADLVWGWGFFTRGLVIGTWVVIAAGLVAYLVGLLRLGHAPRLGRPGAARLTAATAGVALAVWLGLGLDGRRLGELEAFLPPADLGGTPSGELTWTVNDYDAALAEAAREGRPLLIDFTGYTCTNCRWMEANMFTRPEVEQVLAQYVRVRLYTDGRGDVFRRHQQMQSDVFGTVALPYYAAVRPDGQPIVAFGGLTRDAGRFVSFLQQGLR